MKKILILCLFLSSFLLHLNAAKVDISEVNESDGSAVAMMAKFIKGASAGDEAVLVHLSDKFKKRMNVLYENDLKKYLKLFEVYDLEKRFKFRVTDNGDTARISLSSQKKGSGKRAGYTFQCIKVDGVWKIDG